MNQLTPEETAVAELVAQKKHKMKERINNFEMFVMDSIEVGMGAEVDPTEFLRDAMETFLEIESENFQLSRKWSKRLKCYLYLAKINGVERWVTIPEDEDK